jgi:iron complex transport system substrate-binding protein
MTLTPLRRRSACLAAALLCTALVLTACGGAPEETPTVGPGNTSETRKVVADNGTIEVPADPRRVAAIGNTSLPFIDLGGDPVGVTEIGASSLSLLPAEQQATFEAATNLGPSGGEVDLEKLAGLKPDLILAQMPDSDFELIEKQLESIAPTVFFGLGAEWKSLADALAEAGNVTATLSEQKGKFQEQVTKIKKSYGPIIDATSFVALDRWENSDPGTFVMTDFGCVEIARDDLGLDFPEVADGHKALPFEQIGELSEYDAILYPVDAEGRPTQPFAPVVETNTWRALPAVNSGHALGVFCPGNNSYGSVLRYLDSLDRALASLPPEG